MGIVHGNSFEHSLGLCHRTVNDYMDFAALRFLYLRGARLLDYSDLYDCIDLEIISLAKDF